MAVIDRRHALQRHLPLLEADGSTHRRDCECARCDAGFGPSESQRQDALARLEDRQLREAAEAALAKKRERDRVKALRLTIALEQEEQQTVARLRRQAELLARLEEDERLEALLRGRRAGKPISEALAEAEATPASSREGATPPASR